jgi:DNA processing protein
MTTALSHDDSLAAWLQLDYTVGLPLDAIRAWLGVLGSASAVVQASAHTLAGIATDNAAIALKAPAADAAAKRQALIDKALLWVGDAAYAGTRHILTWDHPDYPPQLLTIADPPLVLYVQGNPAALRQPAVGIVGARNATQQGVANARLFAQSLADHLVTVVSGLALGIDAAAHEGALLAAHNPFATVAVVGTGIDRVYPAAHRDLAHRIAAQGAVVSEFPIGTPPVAQNFPRRNRLIAGLSRGVLVVEAALRSGSLITARVAGEQGREVLAIPGSIHAPLSKGCHQLLKQGAKLVESAQDVLEELRLHTAFAPAVAGASDAPEVRSTHLLRLAKPLKFNPSNPSSTADALHRAVGASPSSAHGVEGHTDDDPDEDADIDTPSHPTHPTHPPRQAHSQDMVLQAMGHNPVDLEQLINATGLSTSAVLSRLTELELFGQIEMLDGGRYQRLVR